MDPAKFIEIERVGETVVLIPQTDLTGYDFQKLDAITSELLGMLGAGMSVVIDFHKTDYFDSIALAFLMRVWRRVRACNGHMAFCNVSDHEKEILHITKADTLWFICPSRSDALEILRKGGAS